MHTVGHPHYQWHTIIADDIDIEAMACQGCRMELHAGATAEITQHYHTRAFTFRRCYWGKER